MPELTIKMGKTKVRGSMRHFAHTFQSATGEPIIVLLHLDAREQDAEHLIHEWVQTIETTLLPTEEAAYDRLEGCLKELNGLLKGTRIAGDVHEVHAIVAIQDTEGVLHISSAGRAEAYLTRGSATVQITERAGTGKDALPFLHISSGSLQEGDTVILCTERLLRALTLAQITRATRRREEMLQVLQDALEAEQEVGAFAILFPPERREATLPLPPQSTAASTSRTALSKPSRTSSRRSLRERLRERRPRGAVRSLHLQQYQAKVLAATGKSWSMLRQWTRQFFEDLQHPTHKRRAHLLLLAGAIVVFVGIWSGFQLTALSRKSQSRAELEALVEKINSELKTAENRHLMGDLESANAILARAEQEARNVMQHESGHLRIEALDILDRIRAKREAINNIIRLSPTIAANLSTRSPNLAARGLIGIERGRMIAYDRQNLYSIIVNAVDEPQRLDGDNLILDGAAFDRYKTLVFLTKENRLIELIEGQPTAMKTDDPAGWISGPDLKTYLRYLYILSPQNNQIYKYERLSNRYSTPTEYNVNGQLEGAVDMTIDSDVYILHQGGKVTKLLRGEVKNFVIRNLPEGALTESTKIWKPSDRGNFYFLDPSESRIIVTRTDDDRGESLYLKQFILEGENLGPLQDLYVDPEETHLFVLDEKKVYSISLQEG